MKPSADSQPSAIDFFQVPPTRFSALRAASSVLERSLRAAARSARQPRRVALLLREGYRRWRTPHRTPEIEGSPAAGVIVFLPALPWDYRPQRPHHLARALAERGHGVLYVDAFTRTALVPPPRLRMAADRLAVLRVALPGRPDPFRTGIQPAASDFLAELILRGLRQPALFVFAQLPFWSRLALDLGRRLGVPVIYDRLDLHAAFPGAPQILVTEERAFCEGADGLASSSPGLRPDDAKKPSAVVPNAVRLEDFPAAGRRSGNRSVVGYVGALSGWFDAATVAHAAAALPDWTFRLAGRLEDQAVDALRHLRNIELLGEIPYSAVASFLASVDVGVIPFRDTPLTRVVDPVKLYEYLAAGLPVVARGLPDLQRWGPPIVYTYARPDEFVQQLRRAAAERDSVSAESRRALLQGHSWRDRAAQVLELARECRRAPLPPPQPTAVESAAL